MMKIMLLARRGQEPECRKGETVTIIPEQEA